MTYCTLALLVAEVLPKKAAARTASAASCDCVGLDGAAAALSYQAATKIPVWLPAGVPAPLQKYVPLATPWQYWVTVCSQGLPPTPLKKLTRIPSSPLGSLLFHCEPQRTR